MIGTRCKIRGTGLAGLIVGKRTYTGDADRYAVRYLDVAGNPHERWFTSGEISFDCSEAGAQVVSLAAGKRSAA